MIGDLCLHHIDDPSIPLEDMMIEYDNDRIVYTSIIYCIPTQC